MARFVFSASFWERKQQLFVMAVIMARICKSQAVHLVLMGDILDLCVLRSRNLQFQQDLG